MAIHIKPSKRGTLRKAMHAKKGQKLSVSAMRSRLKNASPAMKKKLIFAINARKWKHALGGELPMYQDGNFLASLDNINLGQSFSNMIGKPSRKLVGTNNPLASASPGGGGILGSIAGLALGLGNAIADPLVAASEMNEQNIYDRASESLRKVDVEDMARRNFRQSLGKNWWNLGLGSIGSKKKARIEAEQFNKQIEEQNFNKDVAGRFSTLSQSPTYNPVAKQGGFTVYRGETHDGPTGGILTDEQGNPTGLSNNKPIALTENDEVARYNPHTGSTYIYSDSLGFAKPATNLVHKYKLDKSGSLYKYDPLLQAAVDKQFDNLTTAQEFAKGNEVPNETQVAEFGGMISSYKKGGSLTASKARKILHDGTIRGKKITDRQRRFFGWVSGGRKKEGGELVPEGFHIMPDGTLMANEDMYASGELLPTYQGLPGETSILQDSPYSLYPGVRGWATGEGLLRDIFRGEAGMFKANPNRPWQTYAGTVNYIPVRESLKIGTGKPYTGDLSLYGPELGLPPGYLKSGKVTPGGVGVGRKTNPLVGKVGVPEMEMPTFYKKPWEIREGLAKGPTMPEITPEQVGAPWLSPAGHLLSGVGAIADYAALSKAKPTPVSIPRVGAERINLAKQRLINERNAAATRSINAASARGLGLNAGSTMANITAANTGVNRLLGEQNIQSLLAEEQTNAQMQQQANMVNAELAAQEELFNTQRMDAYKMLRARMNPMGNLARTAASYFTDNAAYQRGYDTLQMLAPNAELYRNPNAKWKKNPFARPRVRVRDKSLFT